MKKLISIMLTLILTATTVISPEFYLTKNDRYDYNSTVDIKTNNYTYETSFETTAYNDGTYIVSTEENTEESLGEYATKIRHFRSPEPSATPDPVSISSQTLVVEAPKYSGSNYKISSDMEEREIDLICCFESYTDLDFKMIFAIMASINQESTYIPNSNEYGSGCGYGLCQWTTSDRKEALYAYQDTCGFNYTTMECQVMFCVHELKENYSSCYKKMIACENNAYGCAEAAKLFCKYYEAPSKVELRCEERADIAYTLYNKYCGIKG